MKLVTQYSHFSVLEIERGWRYVSQSPGAAVLPILPDGSILLVKQDRPFIKSTPWEIPRGGVEGSETPEQAARRELLEETGYSTEDTPLSLLGTVHPDSGILAAELPIFCAFLTRMQPDRAIQEGETLEIKAFDGAAIRDLILSGQLRDSISLSALTLYHERFMNGQRPKKYELSATFFLRDLKGDYFNAWYPDALRLFEGWGFRLELSNSEPLMLTVEGTGALTDSQIRDFQESLHDIGKHCIGRFWVTQFINGQEHIDDYADPTFTLLK